MQGHRRSERIYFRQREMELLTASEGPCGLFNLLPLELTYAVLDRMVADQLARLALTSRALCRIVQGFICSSGKLETLLFSWAGRKTHSSRVPVYLIKDQFSSLGKFVTLLRKCNDYPTSNRHAFFCCQGICYDVQRVFFQLRKSFDCSQALCPR